MEGVLQWVKGLVILFIVGNVLLYLVQGKVYEKYVQLFFQVVVILAVIAPIGSVVVDQETFLNTIDYEAFRQELDNVRRDSQRVTDLGQSYAVEQYEDAVEQDVLHMLERMEYSPSYVEAQLSDAYEIESIRIGFEEAGAWPEVVDELTEYYQLEEEQITIEEARL